jgi:hypothetical protein
VPCGVCDGAGGRFLCPQCDSEVIE